MIRVSCLAFEGFLLLDAAGPLAAFELAGHFGPPGYVVEILGARDGIVACSGGVKIAVADFRRSAGCDVLLVPGGFGARDRDKYNDLLDFIAQTAAAGRRIASVCSGAFLLADAGLLKGRKAATHWGEAPVLAQLHPDIEVDADSLYLQDGNIWTSAGITAGIDMALAMIESDCGIEVAKATAKGLVVPFRRPGTQSQHSALLDMVAPENRFSEVLAWARSNLAQELPVERLADRAGLSLRQFTRAFTASIGVSPSRAVERMRVESARAAIEAGDGRLDRIARDNGFGEAGRMRRAFMRIAGEPPQAIRRRAMTRRRMV